jgi:hypothetical protein
MFCVLFTGLAELIRLLAVRVRHFERADDVDICAVAECIRRMPTGGDVVSAAEVGCFTKFMVVVKETV